jgi:hypothetical protein
VEKDIERDARALAEMQAKVARSGLRPTGIPIIDFRGSVMEGFHPERLERLLAPR